MSTDREQLNAERRHLAQATRALTTVLETDDARDLPLLDFYRAAVTYLAFNMQRLCLQDQRLGDLIAQRCDTSDAELAGLLEFLSVRLEKYRQLNATLVAKLTTRQATGPGGQADFEQAVRHYLEARKEASGGRHHTLARWRDEVITDDDWIYIAAVTNAEAEAERTLFDRMVTLAPDNLNLFANDN